MNLKTEDLCLKANYQRRIFNQKAVKNNILALEESTKVLQKEIELAFPRYVKDPESKYYKKKDL